MSRNTGRRGFLGKLLGAGSAAAAAGLPTASALATVDHEQSPTGIAGHILLTGNFRVPCAAVIEEESRQLWHALYRVEGDKVLSREAVNNRKLLGFDRTQDSFLAASTQDVWSETNVARRENLYKSLNEYQAQGWRALAEALDNNGFKAPSHRFDSVSGDRCDHTTNLQALHALRLPRHIAHCGVYRWPYVDGPTTIKGGRRCIGYAGNLGFAVLATTSRVLATPQEVLRSLQERLGTLQLLDARADVWCDLQHTATVGHAHAY